MKASHNVTVRHVTAQSIGAVCTTFRRERRSFVYNKSRALSLQRILLEFSIKIHDMAIAQATLTVSIWQLRKRFPSSLICIYLPCTNTNGKIIEARSPFSASFRIIEVHIYTYVCAQTVLNAFVSVRLVLELIGNVQHFSHVEDE